MKFEKGQRVRMKGSDRASARGVILGAASCERDEDEVRIRFDAGGGSGVEGMDYPVSDVELDGPLRDLTPPGDWVSGKEHAAVKGELVRLQKQVAEAVAAKSRGSDILGENQALRSRVDELEGNEAWLRREVVRLGGKARGSR